MRVAFSSIIAIALTTTTAFAAPTVIDFEDLPVDQQIGRKYVAKGVIFDSGFIDTNAPSTPARTCPVPHSGQRVAHIFQPEFGAAPMTLEFTTGQAHVSFFGGGGGNLGVAKAYDASGNVIAQDGPKALTGSYAVATAFDLRVASPTIAKIDFVILNGNIFADTAMDDLLFEGGAPPPPVPMDTPVVVITAPPNGAQLDASSVTLTGTVSGNGLLPNASITVDHARLPWDQVPPDAYSITLAGTGNNLTFSQVIRLPLGALTVTVKASNLGGKDGTATINLVNLPSSIRGDGSLGPIRGSIDAGPSCRIAVFANGALATDGTQAFTITATMMPKWLQWVSARKATRADAYCPTENERPMRGSSQEPPPGPVRVQNFRGGRIFANLPDGSHYVPAVFAAAIDQLAGFDGEIGVGIPTSDPKTSPTAKTWLFQQFARLDQSSAFPTTLEIKGSPPKLWLERQGAFPTVLTNTSVPWVAWAPTIAVSRPCSGQEGPCDLTSAPKDTPLASPDDVCSNRTYPFGPPEWTAVTGNYDLTPVWGLVRLSKMSDGDWLGSHSYSDDWNIYLAPLPGSRNVLSTNNLVEMELEWEEYFSNYFFVKYTTPQAGDLMLAIGRWIVDCGHGPPLDKFTTEIHPPSLVAFMRTSGQSVTEAYIWVNGFYTGAPLDVDITPPPRPAPNAFLAATRPRDADAAVGLSVNYSSDDDDFAFVRAHFSAPTRLVSIDGLTGEMMWQSGREYMGRWTAFWQIQSQFPVGTTGPSWWP